VDPGGAAQRVDLEPGIVRERPLPGVAGDLDRLLPRVGGERVAVFDDVGKVGLFDDRDRKIGLDLTDQADHPLVLRGDDAYADQS